MGPAVGVTPQGGVPGLYYHLLGLSLQILFPVQHSTYSPALTPSTYLGHVGEHEVRMLGNPSNHLTVRLAPQPLLGQRCEATVNQHLVPVGVVA